MITISFIGTKKYKNFFPGFYESINNFFCNDEEKLILVSTDEPEHDFFKVKNVKIKKIEHKEWPYVTLHRFKYLLDFKEEILNSKLFFFIDADLWPSSKIELKEIDPFDKKFVGVQHPGFLNKIGTFETNTKSLANIFDNTYDLKIYRQGCFWGGKSESIIEMIEELDRRIDVDSSNGVVARWHDESHMNKYFLERNELVRTLHAGFAQPEKGYEEIRRKFETKMIHLSKRDDDYPRFPGGKI